ncbi:hypothetical protein [Streptomyces sp. NPDC059743]|uniref:hypothetical protein n=1 Tax=Streptomyces sp. NPDC059743 TaxID=3346928 RepID=UPI0036549EBC
MKRTKLRTVSLGLATVVASLGLMVQPATASASVQPVSASTGDAGVMGTVYYIKWNGYEGQIDLSPGNGKEAWVWAYNGGRYPVEVRYQFYSGNVASTVTTLFPGESKALDSNSDIWRMRFTEANPFARDNKDSGWLGGSS